MVTENNHARKTERLAKLASGFLSFGTDPVVNINLLTRLCGELMGADCALYNHLDRGMLVSLGMWNTPAGFEPKDKPDGHICCDVIKKGGKEVFIVRDLPRSSYAKTDPNIGKYNLKTYIGLAVKYEEKDVGSLCLLYHDDFSPSPEDSEFIGLISKAIGLEEERMRAGTALRESEEVYRALFDQARDSILLLEVSPEEMPVIWDANDAALRMHGYSREELLGKTISLLDTDTTESLMRERGRQIQAAKGALFEVQHRHKDGSAFDIEVSAREMVIGGKRLLLNISRDITERMRNERELRERNDELTRFSYAVSHDLKSPLVTIMTFLGYMEEDIKEKDALGMARDLNYIRTAADKMHRLLTELLALSRVWQKTTPYVEMPLRAVLEEALVLAAGRISKRGVKTRITGERVTLFGDRQRLLEVFQNLFDNAAKFMGEQPDPLIEAGGDLSGAEPVLFVRDNGIGIDPRHQAEIFGLFGKLDPATEGTGIGLALVRRIIEVHGGRIWVESEGAGRGTTFRFTLANIKRDSNGSNCPVVTKNGG